MKHVQPPKNDNESQAGLIRCFNAYGQEMAIPREEWRRKVLPVTIKNNWNNPDQLYAIVVQSLQDGYVEDIASAARQLNKIDPIPSRGATILGIVEMKLGRLDEAERVLQRETTQHGENGVILTNLAKVYSDRGENDRAEELLWHALELDPNQDNGLLWWVALHRDRGGEEAGDTALRRVASLPGSWRAHLWLARAALDRGDKTTAMQLYQAPLSLPEIPDDVLMQISGDLGNHDHVEEMVDLVGPIFRPDVHSITTGKNLLKAYVELGRFTTARDLLQALYARQRPDWRETLEYWARQIDDRTHGFGATSAVTSCRVVAVVGPVWAREQERFAGLLPQKAENVPYIAVMMPSCSMRVNAEQQSKVVVQRTNIEGGLSRALGLALAEAIHLDTSAEGGVLVPLTGDESGGGFVFSGHPHPNDTLIKLAVSQKNQTTIVIGIHIDATGRPWHTSLTAYNKITHEPLLQVTVGLDPDAPDRGVQKLESAARDVALRIAKAKKCKRPAWAALPQTKERASWMAGAEQLLAVLCATLDDAPRVALYGERNIVDGMFGACLSNPNSARWRMLLVTVLNRLADIQPKLVGEYTERLVRLQHNHQLKDPPATAIQQTVDDLIRRTHT